MVWLLAFCVLAFAPAALVAQEEEDQATLTLKDVKNRLKENKSFLDQAKSRGKAGDAEGIQTAIENYDRGMTGLNQALEAGQFEGSERDHEKALEQVEQATRKHGEVLSDLLTKVPEEARPGIERALANSQKGRETALANLERVRAERQERAAAQRRQGMGQPGATGQPGTVGRPSGVGAPGGVGRPGGVGGGRPSGVGGGPPGGGPGRP
jgi:hypothetical protein